MAKRTLIAIGAALLGAALFYPAAALAGPSRYVYELCDSALPAGGIGGAIWAPHPRSLYSSENSCSRPGGALVIRQNQFGPNDGGAADWAVPLSPPPGAGFESITITASSCGAAIGSIWAIDWVAPATTWPAGICSQEVRTFRLAERFRAFFVELSCGGSCPAGPWIEAHYFAVTMSDPAPPSLGDLEGSLLDPGLLRGRRALAVRASDTGGGVATLSIYVNGLPAAPPQASECQLARANNSSVFGTVATRADPCPREAEAHWTLDTGSYPFRDGPNSVRVCAADFATLGDANLSCTTPQTVEVDNSCAESPVAGGEVLSAQFERSNAEEVTVGYGKGAAVVGRLANDAGDPIRGATLCVKMQTIGTGERAAAVGSATTDASGHYRYEVPPGPNREISVGYRHDTAQVAREVRYYARARPQLRLAPAVLRNGARVHLWGRLPGPLPGRRVVVLQANAPGSKRWITFRKATTSPAGAFHSAYRFTSTTRRTRYRFRAVVPRQAGYPWVEGHSKPAAVIVTG